MTPSQALSRLKSLEYIIIQNLKEYDKEGVRIGNCASGVCGSNIELEFNYAMRELTKSIADMESELLELYRENKRLRNGEED